MSHADDAPEDLTTLPASTEAEVSLHLPLEHTLGRPVAQLPTSATGTPSAPAEAYINTHLLLAGFGVLSFVLLRRHLTKRDGDART